MQGQGIANGVFGDRPEYSSTAINAGLPSNPARRLDHRRARQLGAVLSHSSTEAYTVRVLSLLRDALARPSRRLPEVSFLRPPPASSLRGERHRSNPASFAPYYF